MVASLGAAAAVAGSGRSGVVGLIVPHAVRLVAGVSHRRVIPLSLLFGGAFLAVADVAARIVQSPAEMPIGVITAFIGAPFFLSILRRQVGPGGRPRPESFPPSPPRGPSTASPSNWVVGASSTMSPSGSPVAAGYR